MAPQRGRERDPDDTDPALAPRLPAALRDAFVLGAERTQAEDIGFGIRQLVEMCLRALSPGINDVFTAVAVTDSLSAALGHIYARETEPVLLYDGSVRIIRSVSDHTGMTAAAFDQIRQAGQGKPAVLIRLLEALRRASAAAGRPG
ncbi:DUF2254 family protein [Rhodospirillum centenum]|uniref:Uncharacterized protein n=1 Tax=Rhodospirillum centenum (strain ATCC 51521 / SW) TaxID=414684 RepID=B6IPT4_RHOCS|nr:DUF2254 family protein [Rhodospirillum centenum]ACI97470.1 conserved hypothetical protein [Rhodospirillum centenum SW]